jgi:hypothetical protein
MSPLRQLVSSWLDANILVRSLGSTSVLASQREGKQYGL